MNVDVCPFPNGTLVEMWYLKFSKCFLLLCFFIYIYIYIVQWCRAHSFYWDIYFHLYLHVEKKLFPNFFLLVNLEFLSKDKIILCSMLWYHKNSTGHIFFSFPFSLTGHFRKGSPVRVFRWWWGSLSARFLLLWNSHLGIEQVIFT